MHKHQVPKNILQNRNITLRLIIVINISLAAPCPNEYGAVNLRIVPPKLFIISAKKTKNPHKNITFLFD